MKLYVLPENQKLLWDTMCKVNLFNNMLKNNNKHCEQWFKSIIEQFYNDRIHKNQNLSKNELLHLNKETISFMISRLKTQNSYQPIDQSNIFNNSYSINTNDNETQRSISQKKQNELNNEYQQRQKEFENFFKRPTIEEIDFREKDNEDKPIENMDELLQIQMKEREYDIQPIVQNQEKVEIDSIDLENNEKKVSWAMDSEPSKTDVLEKKMNDFMLAVQEQINSLRNEIEFMKQEEKTKKEDNINPIIRLRSIEIKNEENEEMEQYT